MDIDYEGSWVRKWIESSIPIDRVELKGCVVSDSESMWEIVEADNNSMVILEEGAIDSRRVTLAFLSDRTVSIPINKTRLIKAFKDSLSPLEIIEEQAKLTLLKHGISPSDLHGGSTEIKVAKILDEWDKNQTVPSDNDRIYFYESAKQSKEVTQAMVPIVKKWCEKVESNLHSYDAISRLCLAVLLRISGNFDESLEVSDVIDLPQSQFRCNNHIRAMICCDRAAVFLDKFERRHNRDYIQQAEKYLKRAFANESSEAVSLCYKRLKSYKELN